MDGEAADSEVATQFRRPHGDIVVVLDYTSIFTEATRSAESRTAD